MRVAVDDVSFPILGKGDILMKFGPKTIKIKEVMYSLNLRRNLMSGPQFDVVVATFIGGWGEMKVQEHNKTIFKARLKNGIYYVSPSLSKHDTRHVTFAAPILVNEQLSLYAKVSCAISPSVISRTCREKGVVGLPDFKDIKLNSELCRVNKFKRVSFKPLNEIRSKNPLELLYIDIWGPSQVRGKNGELYYLTIIDDYSRKAFLYPIEEKSDACYLIERHIYREENFLGRRVKAFRTDNGGEFIGNALENYFVKKGIKHELTNIYNPEQNGVPESYNQTAASGARTVLDESGLHKSFWTEAMIYFTYNWNRRINQTDENFGNVSPFLVEKAITGSVGIVTSTKLMRTGDLLVEVASRKQAQQILTIHSLSTMPVSIKPHETLNTSKDVITCGRLLNRSIEEITHELSGQGVKDVRRINIRRDVVAHHRSNKNKTDKNETSNANAVNLPSDSSRGNFSGSDLSVTSAPEVSNPQKNRARSKSEKLHKLKQAKCGFSQKDLPAKLKSTHKNSVPLGLADRGIVHKDLPSILRDVPQVSGLQLHPSEEDEDLQMNCDVSATSPCVLPSQIPTLLMGTFVSWNCRGIRSKLQDIKEMINNLQPVCIGLQETFLSSKIPHKLRGYNSVRKDGAIGAKHSGGVCILTSNLYPSAPLTLHTFLQFVAVQVHARTLVTICSVYLPPHDVIGQHDLDNLIEQLPTPFLLLDDFNGHSALWDSDVTNSRGRQIEQFISNNCLCLLNNNEKTYFHEPTRTFHSLDLAICSPTLMSLLDFTVGSYLYNSDHFPLIVSYADSGGAIQYPPRYLFQRADWEKFMQLADVTESMVCTADITEAVQNVVDCIINAANNTILICSPRLRKFREPWCNEAGRDSSREEKKTGTFLEGIRQQKTMSLLSVPKPLLVAYVVVVRVNLGLISFHPLHPPFLLSSCG
ncbi:Retrovirus-related Pol polyprotein from transposon TNT 1-94 [Araneus ventricosus]|uniref:Retrovirus-related Pol polyprotein from transposon TNT 1-94 n=1 Tax=Araneus ventricosus TaxID=182803 RepID=A0A4Y2EBL7_ARAVE|nr:Retrovirus-related Pol polyprotein from transposon TNT 1-94 [Araneus ventricosus]